MNKKTT